MAACGGAGGGEDGERRGRQQRTGSDSAVLDRAPTPRPRARLINHGPRSRRQVALTFDADMTRAQLEELRADPGASPWFDARVLAELERTRTHATMFLAGLWVRAHPDVARGMARSPLFEIANHSHSHRAFDTACFGLEPVTGAAEKRHEVVRSHEIIEAVTGESPYYFRFPGGCYARGDLRLVAAAGEQPLGWDVVGGDPGQRDPSVVVRNVLSEVKPGSIVVLHIVGAPNAPTTAAALPEIISGLRARGYSFVTLEQLLRPAREPGDRR